MASFRYQQGDRPLDGFTIEQAVGRGGFGEVYYALSDSGRQVAIKAVQNYEDIELRGIGHVMNLKSPHLVSVFDIKHNGAGDPFVIMEYISGQSLRDIIDQSPGGLGEAKAAYFLREMAKGISYLHDCGVVHRDLKPHNVFYEDGIVKVGDYSLSKLMATSHRTGHTMTVGSVHYMAPEISMGRYDKTVDIYALGIMLYEMLTGEPPFRGESMGEILMRHMSGDVDVSALQQPFRDVVSKALAKDPDERYQTADEMASAVFGDEHIQNSVAGFAPEDLSIVARRATEKAIGGHPPNHQQLKQQPSPAVGNRPVIRNIQSAVETPTVLTGSYYEPNRSHTSRSFMYLMGRLFGQFAALSAILPARHKMDKRLFFRSEKEQQQSPDRISRTLRISLAMFVMAVLTAFGLIADQSLPNRGSQFVPGLMAIQFFVISAAIGASTLVHKLFPVKSLAEHRAYNKNASNALQSDSYVARAVAVRMVAAVGIFFLGGMLQLFDPRVSTGAGPLIACALIFDWRHFMSSARPSRIMVVPILITMIVGILGGDGLTAPLTMALSAVIGIQVLFPHSLPAKKRAEAEYDVFGTISMVAASEETSSQTPTAQREYGKSKLQDSSPFIEAAAPAHLMNAQRAVAPERTASESESNEPVRKEQDSSRGVGSPISPTTRPQALALALAGFPTGICGLHRFASGRKVSGFFYLFSYGFLGIGQLIDVVMIALGSFRDSAERPVLAWSWQQSDRTIMHPQDQPVPVNQYSSISPPRVGLGTRLVYFLGTILMVGVMASGAFMALRIPYLIEGGLIPDINPQQIEREIFGVPDWPELVETTNAICLLTLSLLSGTCLFACRSRFGLAHMLRVPLALFGICGAFRLMHMAVSSLNLNILRKGIEDENIGILLREILHGSEMGAVIPGTILLAASMFVLAWPPAPTKVEDSQNQSKPKSADELLSV